MVLALVPGLQPGLKLNGMHVQSLRELRDDTGWTVASNNELRVLYRHDKRKHRAANLAPVPNKLQSTMLMEHVFSCSDSCIFVCNEAVPLTARAQEPCR